MSRLRKILFCLVLPPWRTGKANAMPCLQKQSMVQYDSVGHRGMLQEEMCQLYQKGVCLCIRKRQSVKEYHKELMIGWCFFMNEMPKIHAFQEETRNCQYFKKSLASIFADHSWPQFPFFKKMMKFEIVFLSVEYYDYVISRLLCRRFIQEFNQIIPVRIWIHSFYSMLGRDTRHYSNTPIKT